MAMTADEVLAAYSRLEPNKQLRVLAGFARALTVVARGTYVPLTEDIADPRRLRVLNEIQHRVTAQMDALIRESAERFPDDAIFEICTYDDPELLATFEKIFRERTS